jgi:GDP-L-fucose synthase
MKVLITGGNGMVGKNLRKLLPDAFAPSSSELDLMDASAVKQYMHDNKFNTVIHLAAYVGSLHDNIENRTKYFDNNILMNTVITKYAYESGVVNFLGILSTCIYPDDCSDFPIKEEALHKGAPHVDLMSYAYAKRSHAVQLDAYKESFGVNYNYLIPCNLYGIVDESHEGRSHFVNDLIFKIIRAKSNKSSIFELFGDGTPLRQFMHAEDFSSVIYKYIDKNLSGSFNVAPDINMSVDNIARVALKSCDATDLTIKYSSEKTNGQLRKDVDTSLMKKALPDVTFRSLEDGIRQVYDYYVNKNSSLKSNK